MIPSPINRRNVLAIPHRHVAQTGMEGSDGTFKPLHVPVLSKEINKRNRKGEAPQEPMNITITWDQEEEHCSDCNRLTHLEWDFDGLIKARICQGCAKWKGASYREALYRFLEAIQ